MGFRSTATGGADPNGCLPQRTSVTICRCHLCSSLWYGRDASCEVPELLSLVRCRWVPFSLRWGPAVRANRPRHRKGAARRLALAAREASAALVARAVRTRAPEAPRRKPAPRTANALRQHLIATSRPGIASNASRTPIAPENTVTRPPALAWNAQPTPIAVGRNPTAIPERRRASSA